MLYSWPQSMLWPAVPIDTISFILGLINVSVHAASLKDNNQFLSSPSPKSKVPKSRLKGLGLTQKSHYTSASKSFLSSWSYLSSCSWVTSRPHMDSSEREELKIMIFKRPSHFDRQYATDVGIYIESKIICKNESNRPNECFGK